MEGMSDLSQLTKIIGEPSRIKILTVLTDKRYYTVNELAKRTKITASTASYHLKMMTELNWLASYKRGRFSYYALINDTVAELLEKMMELSPLEQVKSYKQKQEVIAVKKARTCYQHLAGKLGVLLLDFLVAKRYVLIDDQERIILTTEGKNYLFGLGLNVVEIEKESGPFAKLCLDWSERRFHLAGNLGKALYHLFLEKGWLAHSDQDRSVRVTEKGHDFFADVLSVNKV